jgi:hypothetical protein
VEPRARRRRAPEWPDVETVDAQALGLVSVLVTRRERYGRVRLCGWLVDVYCLGVKNVVGPRAMDERRAAELADSFFAATSPSWSRHSCKGVAARAGLRLNAGLDS